MNDKSTFDRASGLKKIFIDIRGNKLFELFVITVIVISALRVGISTYPLGSNVTAALEILDYAVTIFFLIELVIRMVAEHNLRRFFSKGWNIFDFVIVAASLIPVDESQMALLGRLLRIFRVMRLVSMIPELQVLLNALLQAIPRMGYVTLLMFIIFYIYGAAGSIFYADINPTLWGNISISMLTLFRVATFEDWTDVMYETMEVYPLSWIFYLSFIFLVAFVFLNMMIGIVIQTLQSEHEKLEGNADQRAPEMIASENAITAPSIDVRLARIEARLDSVAGMLATRTSDVRP
ncbi:MAG: ion transporter [Methyloceanibacter sp.]|uniref:ion transporter n=1 Tax=Methyloceanibacter sp. TaxID=1965321 RepID=UPI001D1DF251|nr:ion transporter [Methyloceanibacter sp.]MCB1442611.1 ion transporter [Methyloceanibacter sp.]MCC0059508.1 ion transporter [Hyphomicrobiaceae bacterium]